MRHQCRHAAGTDGGEMQSVGCRIGVTDHVDEISFWNQNSAILFGEPPLNLAKRDLVREHWQFEHHH